MAGDRMLWEGARACLIIFQIRKIMRRHTITAFPQKELYQTSKFSSVCTIPICNKCVYFCPAAPSSVVFIWIRSSIYFMKRRTNIHDSRFQRHLVVAYPYHVIERADNCVMHVRFGSSGVPCDFQPTRPHFRDGGRCAWKVRWTACKLWSITGLTPLFVWEKK